MSFLYPLFIFAQPAILMPALEPLRPMPVLSLLALLVGWFSRSIYERRDAWRSKEFFWLVMFIFVQGISVYSTGVSGMIQELSYWSGFLFFVVTSILLIRDEHTLSRYVWGTLLGALVVVLFGIYAVPAWGGYIGSGRAGAYGMYENHNDYTFIILQILPYLYFFWKRETKTLRKWVLVLGLVACPIGIALSMSRGGILALVLEVTLIVLVGMEGRRRLWLLPVIGILGSGAIAFQYARRAENSGSNYTAEDAESSRFELWKAGGYMVLDKPLLGVGSRRFPEFSRDYYEISHDQYGKVSHNTFIEVASTSGLLGFTSFMMMGLRLIKDLKRSGSRPDSDEGTGAELDPSSDADTADPEEDADTGPRRRMSLLNATRRATLIGIYVIAFRGFFDAKAHDWSFYSFCAIGIACCRLRDRPVE